MSVIQLAIYSSTPLHLMTHGQLSNMFKQSHTPRRTVSISSIPSQIGFS